jgi:1-deoxy-D-xylulose-5-phosphate synthase
VRNLPGVFERVNYPSDLKNLTYPELDVLAREIRDEIIVTISRNGGHLASSLGTVELTLALHRVFDAPRDKIIWDVGHQAYAHKLITGRKDRFDTIRQMDGLSGFPTPGESPYDSFVAGHAGNSISAALGMGLARDLKKDNFQVIAVIGDGSLATGMAFEAINHAGHKGTKIILVLNDNGMSISPTLGAMSRLLNQVRIDSRYESAKNKVKSAFRWMPFGGKAWDFGIWAKKNVERVFLPNAFWEQMGFIYLGPLDGHNLRELESAMVRARDFEHKPVLLHVLTTKGKGHELAENNATHFHGISPTVSVKENGSSSYSQVFGSTVEKLMAANEKIVAISAAMLDGTGLANAQKLFPERVLDVGIGEQHAVTLAAGLAAQGLIPIVAVYSTFLQRAYDQIVHDVCIPNLPVVFAVDRAGIVGEDGATHQGALDVSYLNTIPNMIISAPADENELQHLLYTAVLAGAPMAVRYPRGPASGASLEGEFHRLDIGKGEVLRRGADLTICALGSMVQPALQAALMLAEGGAECTVINARFAKPLDRELILKSAAATGKVVTIEENTLKGGFGSAVRDLLTGESACSFKSVSLGLPDEFIEHGAAGLVLHKYNLDAAGIANGIKAAFPELAADGPALSIKSGP